MTVILIVALIVLTAVVALACGALLEVFRQLDHIRSVLDLEDEPIPLALAHTPPVSELSLPSALGHSPEAILVFLSDKCGTCLTVANAFRGGSPSSVWFVISGSPDEATYVTQSLKSSVERVILDSDGSIARSFGLDVTPAVITLRHGNVAKAQAVSSARQVLNLIPVVPVAAASTRPGNSLDTALSASS